ncbi:MAG TPA: radical SAM protein [Geobacteraceae bacterium]|nr:radical SAM protein [Geobacteraceae bacterium]
MTERVVSSRERLIEENLREYGYRYDLLAFATPDRAEQATAERTALLQWLAVNALIGYRGTKVDCRGLSPGCQACGAGSWSCLFVNGRCNARCAYCPAPQDELGMPATNGLPFASAEDYTAYVELFGFTGVSISGGEPLLTPDRTLDFISAVRRRCGRRVHIWLYTNGTLLDRDLCRRLADAGLDEIRFDIGATRYHLKKARLAVGVIPTVTVEIPAMPEDEELIRSKLPELAAAGIDHLNLHQLRLTPHNLEKLAERGYTFLHGEKITVLESELMALRLVRHALEQAVSLPINYCSFLYKRRFQHASARRRGAAALRAGWEGISEPGYLRTLAVEGEAKAVEAAAANLREAVAPYLWHREDDGRLFVAPEAALRLDLKGLTLTVRHDEVSVLPAPSGGAAFRKVPLPSGRALYLVRRTVAEAAIPVAEMAPVLRAIDAGEGHLPVSLLPYERIPAGLADYF